MSLNNLPAEVLLKIFSSLDAKDMPSLSMVNKRFRSLLEEELIWAERAKQDFGVKLKIPDVAAVGGKSTTCKNIYQVLLHPLRHMFGLWTRADLNHFSQLVRVKFRQEDLKVILDHVLAPVSVRDPVRFETMLAFKIGDNGCVQTEKGTSKQHETRFIIEYRKENNL